MTKKFVVGLVALLVSACASPVLAQVPVCHLGGPTAMNPNRQLAEGETFTLTDRPLIVNLEFKPTKEHPERVGECMLASGKKVAQKNGILQWVAECGNDEVNKNIPVGPIPLALAGAPGKIGPRGLRGLPGPKGDPGSDGIDGRDGRDGQTMIVEKKSHGKALTVAIIAGAALGASLAGNRYWHHDASTPPQGPIVITNPPTGGR